MNTIENGFLVHDSERTPLPRFVSVKPCPPPCLSGGLKCVCPSMSSSSIFSLGFATILPFSGLYFWWYSCEGRNAPFNFSLTHYNLLSWGSLWCLICHPSQLGLWQHCCLRVEPLPQSQLWSFVPFSRHLCTLLILSVVGELILSMFSGCSLPVSVSLLKCIQKQFSLGGRGFFRAQGLFQKLALPHIC